MKWKYNELAYAELICNNGIQSKYLFTELKLLVLYYRDVLELKPKERELALYNFCYKYIYNFKKEKYYKIIKQVLNKGLNKEVKLIVVDKINIYTLELKYINSLDINYQYKKILFAFLVKHKLNRIIYKIKNNKDYNTLYFKGSKQKYSEIKKMSNIPHKLNLHTEGIHNLNQLGLINILYRGAINLDYIENCKEEGDVAIAITDFENVGLYFDYYNKIKRVIKCEECDKPIRKKSNKQKYCSECAKKIRKEKVRENVANYREKQNVIK